MRETTLPARHCPCGTQIASGLLSCPACQRLVYAEELKRLAARAQTAEQEGDTSGALREWRQALDLLPRDSRQYGVIQAKVEKLSRLVEAGVPPLPSKSGTRPAPSGDKKHSAWKGAGAVGVVLLLWKFKWLVAAALSKGKLLLLGLTKASTLFSMILSLGLYWTAWGWKFALGLIVSIYIHEMGHVTALIRYGIKATPPMFLPGVGAVVRLKQQIVSPREDARVGLAGPMWGLGAAAGAYAVSLAMSWPSWAAIARVGAWINLFNLLPVFSLDGARGFHALSRGQRALAAAVVAGAWFLTSEGLLLLLLIVAGARAFGGQSAEKADHVALAQYVFLVAALSALAVIHVPLPI
ncbi:MAG TPA: site-2 protease family protein [Phycisphaerae bacterium]|jgi:Zn-dependent protease|nr:site-2 protease family protein [Phycisphaerae bacterium]HOB72963.1 site-2 protease family protein [Phycisphaerae bacterium]HOJ52988.1 site-2 protease family protein [Phycisphaerae bacterium]HOL24725.1 site-2 protease family protein [Phycisphaerae bacterium]HPP19261.1 site-2 protease family protein [Phycisphaerae bacterium]